MKKMTKLWRTLLYAGADGLVDHDEKRSICFAVNLMCLIIFLADFIAGTTFFIVSGQMVLLLGCLFEAIIVSLIVVLNYFKQINAATISFYLLVNFATFYFGSLLGKAAEAQLMIVFLIGLVLFIFVETWARVSSIAIRSEER